MLHLRGASNMQGSAEPQQEGVMLTAGVTTRRAPKETCHCRMQLRVRAERVWIPDHATLPGQASRAEQDGVVPEDGAGSWAAPSPASAAGCPAGCPVTAAPLGCAHAHGSHLVLEPSHAPSASGDGSAGDGSRSVRRLRGLSCWPPARGHSTMPGGVRCGGLWKL